MPGRQQLSALERPHALERRGEGGTGRGTEGLSVSRQAGNTAALQALQPALPHAAQLEP